MHDLSMRKAYRVFFSHGSEDTFVVKQTLKPLVEGTGAEVFLDAGTIEYGDDFRARLLAALAEFDELLVLLTRSSLKRPWVTAEIGAALIRGKRIIAVRYGPTESELQELGILSLLGTNSLLRIDDFEQYVLQLDGRVKARLNE